MRATVFAILCIASIAFAVDRETPSNRTHQNGSTLPAENVYVSRILEGHVVAIKPENNTIVSLVDTGNTPAEIAGVSSLSKSFVADIEDGTISVLNMLTSSIENQISLGLPVATIDVHVGTQMLYILEFSNGTPGTTLHVMDATSPSDVNVFTIGSRLQNIAVDSTNDRAYATDFTDGVIVFDTTINSVISTIPLANSPHGVAVDSVNDLLYITQLESDTISVYDTTNLAHIDTISVGDIPQWIEIDKPRGKAFVTNEGDDTVSVIDIPDNIVHAAAIVVGANPLTLTISEAHAKAYVYNSGDGTISIIDTLTEQVVSTIDILFFDGFEKGDTAAWTSP